MISLAFDTHRAVKALCEAGAAEPLAEAFVGTIGDAITGNVATTTDIAASEAALKADIAEVESGRRPRRNHTQSRDCRGANRGRQRPVRTEGRHRYSRSRHWRPGGAVVSAVVAHGSRHRRADGRAGQAARVRPCCAVPTSGDRFSRLRRIRFAAAPRASTAAQAAAGSPGPPRCRWIPGP